MSDNNLDQYKLKSLDYSRARRSIKMQQSISNQRHNEPNNHIDEDDEVDEKGSQEDSANQSEYHDKCQISSEPIIKKRLTNKSKNRAQPRSSQSQPQPQSQTQQLLQQQQPNKNKKQAKKPAKKRIKKQQQNEGIKIAKQKKIQYLFRNICNPSGSITIQSLGKALVKHKIQFKLSQLQQMIATCEKIIGDVNKKQEKERRKKRGGDDRDGESDENSESQGYEDSLNFQSNQINEQIRNISIGFDGFNKFYHQKF